MSSYPQYQDLGKSTRDFFTKGFATGSYKLNIKDNPSKNIKATITGSHSIEKQEASGDFQADLTCPVLPGFTSTTKWTTANLLRQEILIKDKIAPGLSLGLEGNYNIDTSSITGKAKSIYKHPKLTFDANVEGGDSANPTVGASIVTGYSYFAAGYQFEVDPNERTLKKNNVSTAFVRGPLSFLTSLENADVVWAGVVYRHNPSIELGLTGTYKAQPDSFYTFGAALKYVMDCCSAFKAKVDSDLQVGLGFETKIRQNAAITMSVGIDATKFNEGGHKVGLLFELES